MIIDHLHLSAFTAILREGSFEKAAQSLSVTPSAISQRIRALEEKMGVLLIIREMPCRPTAEGVKFYRYALQMEILEKDLLHDLNSMQETPSRALPVAVNADSIDTWFNEAISGFSRSTGESLEIFPDDQEHTAQWLKEGRVLGAVTTSSKPVQGCRIEKLGSIRYLPMATPEFIKKHFAGGVNKENFASAPMVAFNRKDRFQLEFIKKIHGRLPKTEPLTSFVPSTYAFHEAVASGLGWGMVIESIGQEYLKRRRLVNFLPGKDMSYTLYWQSWRLTSPTLDALTKAVRKAAKDNLV